MRLIAASLHVVSRSLSISITQVIEKSLMPTRLTYLKQLFVSKTSWTLKNKRLPFHSTFSSNLSPKFFFLLLISKKSKKSFFCGCLQNFEFYSFELFFELHLSKIDRISKKIGRFFFCRVDVF